MTGRRVLTGAAIVAALTLLVGRWVAWLYTEYLWYLSLGAGDVWRAQLSATAVLGVVSFALAFFFVFVNLYAVRQSVVSLVFPRRLANIEIGEEVPGRYLTGAVTALSIVMGALLTFPTDKWHTALLARMGRPFRESDPYFNADLGFFVYWLPFETAAHVWAVVVLVVVSGLVVLLYALTPSLRWERGSLYVSAYVRRHFTMLGAVLLLVLAWSYRLAMYRLLAVGGGSSGVFTWMDHHVLVTATLLLSLVTLCAAVVVAWAGWTGQLRLAFTAVSIVLVLSLVSQTLAPLMIRRSSEPAERAAQERPYLSTHLNFTRRAYAVYRMRADSIGVGVPAIAEASPRVAIWDGATIARAVERQRRVHVSGDGPAWLETPAGIAALVVEHGSESTEPREMWVATRYSPIAADDHGLPLRMSSADELVLTEPAVYDSAPDYTVMSDSLRQLAGVELVSTRSRLMHAWGLQNFRLLFGELPANRPTMIRRRAVRERVGALTPFFVQGSEVLPVVAGDSLYWVLELYAASSTYPLSRRFTVLGEERGYLHHAATALVHAASGRVRLIASPDADPIAESWFAYLPALFTPLSSVSPVLRSLLPPVTDGARAQALAFSAAGFLGGTLETRHFALPDGADSTAAREPGHVLLPSLPGVSSLWPLLDSADRVRGVIVATAGATRATTWIPITTDGNRWGAVVDRLRMADTAQHDAGVIRAPLRVIPVAGQPVYVQSSYHVRAGAPPALVKVSVLAADTVRSGKTLAAIFGSTQQMRAGASTPVSLRQRADSLYRVMREALGRGDWLAFGRAFDALGAALRTPGP